MQFLRQSTAATITVGPAVAIADGFTPVTADITPEDIGVYKHDGTSLVTGTPNLLHKSKGIWTVALTTGQTNTLGRLVFYMNDTDVCYPIRQEYVVINADLYDKLIGSGDFYSLVIAGFGSSNESLHNHLTSLMDPAATAPGDVGTYDPAAHSLGITGGDLGDVKGSGFATGTDSLKQIRDAIDTLVAPVVVTGTSMSGSGFLSGAVTLVRQFTDEPSTIPKYTNTDIVSRLQVAFAAVLADIHTSTDHPILVRHEITLVPGTLEYILPTQVGEIWRVARIMDNGYVPMYEAWPDNHFSGHQSGWVIEENVLRLLNDWQSTDTLEILFVPTGEPTLHYGEVTLGSDATTTIILDATPADGTLDTRANAYAGYMIRILSSNGAGEGYVQERRITAYDNTTRTATMSPALDPTLVSGSEITYEVLPLYTEILKDVVCMQAALDILSGEGNSKKMQTLGQRLVVKMRALRMLISKKVSRFPGHMTGDTSDNSNREGFYGWIL